MPRLEAAGERKRFMVIAGGAPITAEWSQGGGAGWLRRGRGRGGRAVPGADGAGGGRRRRHEKHRSPARCARPRRDRPDRRGIDLGYAARAERGDEPVGRSTRSVMPPVASTIVPTDDALADRLFEAGLCLAEELGAFCVSTSRRIRFTRDEILAALAVAPIEVTIGEGNDRAHRAQAQGRGYAASVHQGRRRRHAAARRALPAVTQSYAQEPLVDAVINCTLERVYGREIRSRSPWEVLAAWHEAELSKAACQRAGRPGLALGCVENAVSEISELSATSYGGFSTQRLAPHRHDLRVQDRLHGPEQADAPGAHRQHHPLVLQHHLRRVVRRQGRAWRSRSWPAASCCRCST